MRSEFSNSKRETKQGMVEWGRVRTLHVAQSFVWEWLIRGTGKYELKRLTSRGGFAKISRDNRRQWQMQIRRLNPRLSRVLLSDLETRRATHMLTHFMDSYGR